VDLLVEHWDDKEFQDRLGLKSGWLESEAVWSPAVPISTNIYQIGSNAFIPITTNTYQKVTDW